MFNVKNTHTDDLKVLVKITISIVMFSLCVFFSMSFLNTRFSTKDVDYNLGFKAMPEESMDVVVLGSSHSQYSFLPSLFYQKTGLYSYILGTPCQPYEVTYEMLKEALKTQSPELIIMEAYTATPFSENCHTDGCYVMASYQMTGEERYNTLGYLDEEKALSYRNEFLNNHNNWRDLENILDILKDDVVTLEETNNDFGYRYNTPSFPVENYWYPTTHSETVDVTLDSLDLESLNNIKTLCDERGIQMMMYMVSMDSLSVEDQAFRYKVWEWCEENGVIYQDQITDGEKMGYFMKIHNGGDHSFTNGAALTTQYLAELVNENFVFEGHQENELLTQKYTASTYSSLFAALEQEYNPLIYGKYFKGYKGIALIRYNNNGKQINNQFLNYMYDLGAREDFYYEDFYEAIIINGELVAETTGDLDYDLNENKISLRRWGLLVNDSLIEQTGNLSIVFLNNNLDRKVIKSVDYSKDIIWEYGYKWYGE